MYEAISAAGEKTVFKIWKNLFSLLGCCETKDRLILRLLDSQMNVLICH